MRRIGNVNLVWIFNSNVFIIYFICNSDKNKCMHSQIKLVVVRHLSPCATTRFSNNVLTKGYINNFINFESIFLENSCAWDTNSSAEVLSWESTILQKKNLIEIGDPQLAYSPCKLKSQGFGVSRWMMVKMKYVDPDYPIDDEETLQMDYTLIAVYYLHWVVSKFQTECWHMALRASYVNIPLHSLP